MNFFKIKPKEKHPVFILFLMFFCIISASITGSSVRDAVFLIHFDKNYLPLMYLFIALVMVLSISVYKKFTIEKDQLSIITVTGIVFSITLLLIQFFLNRWIIPIFYIWMEIITILSAIQFWILAGEVFDTRQAKRLFPLIISGGSFAAIISGSLIKPFVLNYGSENLLFLTIFFLISSIVSSQSIKPYRSLPELVKKDFEINYNFKNLKFDPYLIAIASMVACSAFLSRTIDYQFKILAASFFPTQDALVNFFGSYYITTGVATLLMQFFITGFILKNMGILIGLLILPLSIFLGSTGFLLSGSLIAVLLTKFSDQVFKFSIHNSVRELLWLPLSKKKKLQSKPIIDGTVRASVEGLSGLLIFLLFSFNLLPESKLYLLSIVALFGILFWFWTAFQLKDGYIASIMNSIENRRLNLDKIEFNIKDANTIQTLDLALTDKDEFKQLFALDLLWELPLKPWKNTIQTLFSNGSYAIKRGVIELTWNQSEILPNELILNQIKGQDDIAPYAIMCASDRKIKNIEGFLHPFLKNKHKPISLSAAVAVLVDNMNHNKAKAVIKQTIIENHEDNILLLIDLIKRSPHLIGEKIINKFLIEKSNKIKNAALNHLTLHPDITYLNNIINLLEYPPTNKNAIESLLSIKHESVIEKLLSIINNKHSKPRIRKVILSIMHHFNDSRIIETLLYVLEDPELSILNEASHTLIKISKIRKLEKIELLKIDKNIQNLSKRAFQLNLFKEALKNDPESVLILDHIENDLAMLIPIILRLGTIKEPEIPIELYIRYIENNDTELLPLVLELVESTFSPRAAKLTIPLIDPDSKPLETANDLFKESLPSKNEMLLFWAKNSHQWKTVIAIHYCINKEEISLLKRIDWSFIPDEFFNGNFFSIYEQQYLNRNFFNNKIPIKKKKIMYSILEKTILLKSVELFQNIPGNILAKIAQISSDIQLEPNNIIFKEGDIGKSLYVIISGRVNIIQNDKIITSLGSGHCLGEMALLDQEPRSAGAIANEETILIKIDQEGFYELMTANADIMKQIVKILAQRLRKMNKKLTNDPR